MLELEVDYWTFVIWGYWIIIAIYFGHLFKLKSFKDIKGISGIPGCYFVLIQELEFQLLDLDHGRAMENSVEKL